MIRFMVVMVPLVFLINGLTKHDWKRRFFFALAVAVGLTPEMLPMIVSVCLSKGALAMCREEGHRQAAQLDPELRRDGRALHRQDRHAHDGPRHPGAALRRGPDGRRRRAAGRLPQQPLPDRLKNVLDRAILDSTRTSTASARSPSTRRSTRSPSTFTRRMMSVVVETPEGKDRPDRQRRAGGDLPQLHAASSWTARFRRWTPILIDDLEGGIRAAERRRLPRAGRRLPRIVPRASTAYAQGRRVRPDPEGYVAFLDPPKETAAPAIEALHKPRRRGQGPHRRQRAGQPQDLQGSRPGHGAMSCSAARWRR